MLLEEISSRKSVRSYNQEPISDEVLNEILEAGRLAPSWVNVQPWKFIVIKDEKTKELLFKASGDQKQVLGANVIIACVRHTDFPAFRIVRVLVVDRCSSVYDIDGVKILID